MKVLKYAGLVLLLAIIVFIFWHSPGYVYRVFVWQDADYDDYTRFASTHMQAAPKPIPFTRGTAQQNVAVRARFDSLLEPGTLDSLLTAQETYAFLILQNDTLHFEDYAEGMDRETIQSSFSTAKSVLNLLVGIAIEQEQIESVNDPITKYLPELVDRNPDFARISIDDLLRMRSGLAYKHGISFPIVTSDDPLTYLHPDLRYVALEKTRIETAPDTEFRYNNYNPLLLGIILERATDMSVSAFTQKHLIDPLGFEYDASWSTDENGFEKMESGFNARPIDMAKIGRYLLELKDVDASHKLNSHWYEASLHGSDTIVFSSGHKWGYGRMWWMVLQDSIPAHPFANGRFGQFIYICPISGIIIVRHGMSPDNFDDDDWTSLFYAYCGTQH